MSSNEVAEHYNAVRQDGIVDRQESRIFYMRNINNWIKSQLINEATDLLKKEHVFRPRVLDLGCGKGGDLRKWDIANARSVVMADVASVSIEQARGRYEEMSQKRRGRLFEAEFITADCTKESVRDRMNNKELFDLASCQFTIHYSFVDEPSARTFLRNAVESLKPGGILVGTLPDADRIVWAARNAQNGNFANEVCSVRYENLEELEEGKTPLFGAKFHFTLDSQVNCPEFLAYFPLLKHILEEMDMELLFMRPFPEAIEHWKEKGETLLSRMNGLETYTGQSGEKLMGSTGQYSHADKFISQSDSDGSKKVAKVGTLSESEWEAMCMYLAFAFRKRQADEEVDVCSEAVPKKIRVTDDEVGGMPSDNNIAEADEAPPVRIEAEAEQAAEAESAQ